MSTIRFHGLTDPGRKRPLNEDAFLARPDLGLFGVADGMGGHEAGEVAAALALEILEAEVSEASVDGQRARAALMRGAVEAANAAVHDAGEAAVARRMGCTLTAILVGRDRAVIGHVGDCRAYLFRDGRVRQLTTDHTVVEEVRQLGYANLDAVRRGPMAHVVTRAIGSRSEVEVDILELEIEPGDRFLLCSDGLNDHLQDDADLAVEMWMDLEEVAPSLVRFANESGGHDNVTVVAIDCVR